MLWPCVDSAQVVPVTVEGEAVGGVVNNSGETDTLVNRVMDVLTRPATLRGMGEGNLPGGRRADLRPAHAVHGVVAGEDGAAARTGLDQLEPDRRVVDFIRGAVVSALDHVGRSHVHGMPAGCLASRC